MILPDPIAGLVKLAGISASIVTNPKGQPGAYNPVATTDHDPNGGTNVTAAVIGVYQRISSEGLAAGAQAEFLISTTTMPTGLKDDVSRLVLPGGRSWLIKKSRERFWNRATNGFSLYLVK